MVRYPSGTGWCWFAATGAGVGELSAGCVLQAGRHAKTRGRENSWLIISRVTRAVEVEGMQKSTKINKHPGIGPMTMQVERSN